MTPEAQRIAIAEADGWKRDKDGLWIYITTTVNSCSFTPPDYLNDLNAMHEAEKILTDDQYSNFDMLVYDLVCDELPLSPMEYDGHPMLPIIMAPKDYIRAVSATATQRAEAFLKTIGKWKESE